MCTGRSTGEVKGQSSKVITCYSYVISEWSCAQTFSRAWKEGLGFWVTFLVTWGWGYSQVWGLWSECVIQSMWQEMSLKDSPAFREGPGTRLVSETITIFSAVSAAASTGQDAERCYWMVHCRCIFQLAHTGHVLNVCGLHQSSYEQGFWWAIWCEVSSSAQLTQYIVPSSCYSFHCKIIPNSCVFWCEVLSRISLKTTGIL